MFIALRDLRFARGRFALLGSVVALMTLMVVMLSGLTAGLGAASVSALDALPVDHLALQRPALGQQANFATSRLDPDAASGLAGAYPLGISTTRLDSGATSTAVTVLGGPAEIFPHAGVTVTDQLGLRVGDQVSLGGVKLTVDAVAPEVSFNHLAVVYVPLEVWRSISHSDGITAVALRGSTALSGPDLVVLGRDEARAAVGGYASEQGSLNLMRGVLLAVSALIVGAFFTVWTMQRGHDLAVIRAIGARPGYLLRDALSQAAIVLVGGSLAGAACAVGVGVAVAQAVPFVLDATTVLLPLGAMLLVGLVGAAVSVRKVTSIDPLTALGAAR